MHKDLFPSSYIKELIEGTKESELTDFYQSLLLYRKLSTLQEMQKVIRIIEDEDDIESDAESNDYFHISYDRFKNAELDIRRVKKIIKLFSAYVILPDQDFKKNIRNCISILHPFSSKYVKSYSDNFEKFKKALGSVMNKKTAKKEDEPPTANSIKYLEKDGFAFLTIDKQEVKIGGVNTRKAMLAKVIGTDFGRERTVGTIFDEIRIDKIDNKDSDLLKERTELKRKETLIKGTYKEIQRCISKAKKENKKITGQIHLEKKPDFRNTTISFVFG